jgi:hypothetical protein
MIKRFGGVVLLDFSAAFDIVYHSLLLIFQSLLTTLSKASVSMYADDSTLSTSATTTTEMTATLNKELQFLSEWVARNNIFLLKALYLGQIIH